MTHSNTSTILRRAYERVTAGIGAIALTACLLAFSDARASSEESIFVGPSVTVKYQPEALGTIEGTARIYRKLKSAARHVCGAGSGHLTLAQRHTINKCFDEALANAVRKMDRPQLSALHQAETTRRVG